MLPKVASDATKMKQTKLSEDTEKGSLIPQKVEFFLPVAWIKIATT